MEVKRVFDTLYYQNHHYPQQNCLGHKVNNQWSYYSSQEVVDTAESLAAGMLALGLEKGDKVAIVSYKNRVEWTLVDVACQLVGLISIPLYATISSREYEYILNESECKACFYGEDDLYDKIKTAQAQVPSLQHLYSLLPESENNWKALLSEEGRPQVRERSLEVKSEDIFTIIYTSGTTGNPKGVMLTHDNVVQNLMDVKDIIPVNPGDRVLSFLPLCHVFERVATFAYFLIGQSISQTGTDNLGGEDGDLQSVKPHFFTCVPRLLEKVYEKIYNKGLALTGIKRKLFFWALGLTDGYSYDYRPSGLNAFKWSIADKLIFSKWRDALGGSVKGIVTGAAPCPDRMARVFSAAGIPIREAYGLTEASPGISANRFEPGEALLGTVGTAFNQVTIKIDDSDKSYGPGEGEVCAQGPNIMQGYYKQPEETAKMIQTADDGVWLHTGDIGKWVTSSSGKKFLKITDRKKELLKTSGGKYVAPAPIESKCKEDFLIENIMVVGDKQKFVSALIVPAEEPLTSYCNHNQLPGTIQDWVRDPKVIAKYQQIIDKVNPGFSKIEQIKKFTLVLNPWEPFKSDGSDAELTPTLKLKRRVIRDKYAAEIQRMYEE